MKKPTAKPPCQAEAVQALRLLRSDPTRKEAEKAAAGLILRVRGVAQALTVQSILRAAISKNPEMGLLGAVQAIDAQVNCAVIADACRNDQFDLAEQSEEERLQPLIHAARLHDEQLSAQIQAATRDHQQRVNEQTHSQKRWDALSKIGLLRHEILAQGIPEPTKTEHEDAAERTQWLQELNAKIEQLNTERMACQSFLHSQGRNESLLPRAVLALAEGAAK